ncbi:2-isopropylmalate synthase [Sulfitobacter guttiformis]|uniref:Porin n=1 Tax=Sulfitobacter guttiformis TaxID=74349 RepID=A0A420DT06_9RHOB|nr:2-isopropylmalate synthase [Sulfitobacter guttiformis]KIN74856.1 2-isopropylmalate synthase [Sulfitobacter guttiformis KCTC 32187]RKE97426.1 hypothetical protein C8N30_2030 [Sulfitobacter guttiformis]
MKNLMITTALCCAATGAAAELTYGSAFVNHHNFENDGGNIDLTTLGGAAEFRLNQLTFSGEFNRIDGEGEALDFGSVGVGYALPNGVTLGADYTRFDFGGDSADILSGYALYSFSAYTLGLSAGDSSDLSDTTYSVFGAWDVSPEGTVGADLIRLEGENIVAAYADYDLANYNLQADAIVTGEAELFAVSGAYDLGNNFSVTGSLSSLDVDGDGLTAFSVGGAYEFVPGAKAELAVGRLNVDGGANVNRLSLGVNYEFGRKTSKRRTLSNVVGTLANGTLGLTDF